jgi:hypothetical protein
MYCMVLFCFQVDFPLYNFAHVCNKFVQKKLKHEIFNVKSMWRNKRNIYFKLKNDRCIKKIEKKRSFYKTDNGFRVILK